jgi:hypothetical protein
MVIPLMSRHAVELWDVLVVSAWAAMVFYLDVRYVWPCIVASACVCMRSRDLDVHEGLLAMFMMRHACGAMRAPTPWLSAPVIAVGVWSRFGSYLGLDPMARRLYTLLGVFVCLALLHSTADAAWVSFMRLLLYTGATRHAVFHSMDSWDAVAQSMWLLCSPPYALCLVVIQLNDQLSIYPPRRRTRQSEIWTAHGTAQETV